MSKTKMEKCRYCFPFIDRDNEKNDKTKIVRKCKKHLDKDEHWTTVTNDICDNCSDYECKYIEYPITVSSLELNAKRFGEIYKNPDCGKYVGVRVCGENDEKTYLGIYLGDLPLQVSAIFGRDNSKLEIIPFCNPAIFIPELNRIVFGMESFWYELEDINDLKAITSEDINNVWYVQAAKSLFGIEY